MKEKSLIIIFLTGIGVALFMQNPIILVISCLVCLLKNRRYLLPILFVLPVIEGAFDASSTGTIPIPASLLIFGAISPILLFDILLSSKLNKKIVKWHVLFFLLIIGGYFVAISNHQYFDEEGHISSTIKTFFSVFFSFLVALNIYRKGLDGLKRELVFLLYLSIPIIFLVGINYILFGVEIDTVMATYVNFGYSKHGNFTAYIAMLSLFSYACLAYNKIKWVKILTIGSIILLSVIILKSGSRNGLISFLFATFLFFLLFYKQGNTHKYINLLFIVFISLCVLYNFQNTATIQRIIGGNSAGNLDQLSAGRFDLWKSALQAFTERPIWGYGGTNSAVRYVTKQVAYLKGGMVLHNTPLEFLIRYGLIGFGLYLALLVVIIKRYFRYINYNIKYRDNSNKILMLPLLCFLSLSFSSLFVSWPWELGYWACIGINIGAISIFAHEKLLQTVVKPSYEEQ